MGGGKAALMWCSIIYLLVLLVLTILRVGGMRLYISLEQLNIQTNTQHTQKKAVHSTVMECVRQSVLNNVVFGVSFSVRMPTLLLFVRRVTIVVLIIMIHLTLKKCLQCSLYASMPQIGGERSSDKILCKECAYGGCNNAYDYHLGLARLQNALCGGLKSLEDAANIEKNLICVYVRNEPITPSFQRELLDKFGIDRYSTDLLKQYGPRTTLLPIKTAGLGNCFFDSLSMLSTG